MPSSATTPSHRSRRNVPLWLLVLGDDHPKACTGRRLLRSRLARRPFPRGGAPAGPIVLDPYARSVLSGRDRAYAERHGLLVVDCSWNRLSERGRLGPLFSTDAVHRRLPFLLATNPQHFGRVGELNSAEAFAAALAVLGHEEQARALLAPFHGATAFFEVNAGRLRSYRRAGTSRSVLRAERTSFS